ncbi:DUF4190 domain-containing protein [Streptomyces sp. BI20]|uniref:DUF4190 domain-containing protein n=1 Tax=Streptomyces sp. BI20 TaxID=3403460 RepID=UPI003C70AA77
MSEQPPGASGTGPEDPWAPPARPSFDAGEGTRGTPPGTPYGPGVADQPTIGAGGHWHEGFAGYQGPPPPGYGAPGPDPTAYGAPPYGAAPYGLPYGGMPPYAPPARNGFGVTSLVLGIASLVLCVTSWFAFVLGVLAVVFGVLGQRRVKHGEANNGGVTLAGIITGSVGTLLGLVLGVFVILDLSGALDEFGGSTDDGIDEYRAPNSVSQVLHRH